MAKPIKLKDGTEEICAMTAKDFIIKKGVLYGLVDELKYYDINPVYEEKLSKNENVDKISKSIVVTVPKDECSSIIIPNNVTRIANGAFSNAKKLNKVEMCSVICIDSYAFFACDMLKDIDLFHVKQIKSSAFIGCSSLTPIIQSNCAIEEDSFDKSAKVSFYKTSIYHYEQLANAIIEQAARDYIDDLRAPYCSRRNITQFFRSEYFKRISNANPEYIIENLDKLIREKNGNN